MHVRTASDGDMRPLANFLIEEAREAEGKELALDAASAAVAAALGDSTRARYWIAEAGGITVGAIAVTREWSDWNGAYYWWVQFIYVVPERRGTGVVRALVEHVRANLLREQGVELRLLVHPENSRAMRAYEKLGFQCLPYLVMALRN